ncbi:MAG: DinB family protein [Marinobacter sp.]|uniref:DinB family protein n=1 Tax=Marinobacter sp. TaxID=50741 RepID=UPI00349FF300
MILNHLRALAYFNKAMNDKVYGAARQLPEATVDADKGAFFSSIFGTLNHLVVADTAWLKRFRAHPASPAALQPLDAVPWPDGYSTRMAATLADLYARRQNLDEIIIDWAHQLQESDMAHPLQYQNTQGKPFCKPFGHLALHLFNHQIHHRGQATTLLSQQGIRVEGTGLLPFVADV